MATIVVQDDKILRFLEVILDPDVSAERVAAFRDYLSFDVPDPDAWFDDQRERAATIYPSKIQMVEDEAAMRALLSRAWFLAGAARSVQGGPKRCEKAAKKQVRPQEAQMRFYKQTRDSCK